LGKIFWQYWATKPVRRRHGSNVVTGHRYIGQSVFLRCCWNDHALPALLMQSATVPLSEGPIVEVPAIYFRCWTATRHLFIYWSCEKNRSISRNRMRTRKVFC
jgi:hypothetical protein